jgi:preprotein translocase subunit SecA
VQVDDNAADEAEGPTVESEGVELAPQEFTPLVPKVEAKGLGPQRPQRLEYTAPTIDGEGDVVRRGEDVDDVPEVGPDASRAERRRAERAQRKSDQRRKR